MKYKTLLLLTIVLGFSTLTSCGSGQGSHEEIEGVSKEQRTDLKKTTEALRLQSGMEIKIAQKRLNLSNIEQSLSQESFLKIKITSPGGVEGLGFRWSGNSSADTDEALVGNSEPSEVTDDSNSSSQMTLANTTESKAMTLPIFWPQGDLYLSNSSAIWLSDRAFEGLKESGKTEWNLGILGDSLLGSAQEIKVFERNIKNYNRQLQKDDKALSSALEIKANDKLIPFTLKINGTPTRVEARLASNDLAEYTILNQYQNPLILEVRLLPHASRAQLLTSPLTALKSFLEYRVEEISVLK